MLAIRGATTINSNTKEDITLEVSKLINEIAKHNDLSNVVYVMISTTKDITAIFPATAIRESGLVNAPLFSCAEPDIDNSLKMCIRLLILSNLDGEAKHIYLNQAKNLRKDLCEKYNIAIDGPSGSGKSTSAKAIASKLGVMYLDTGALYRTVGLKAHDNNWEEDDAKVCEYLKSTNIEAKYDKATNTQIMLLDGHDVTKEIRQHFVSDYGSKFSALPAVRAHLLGLQRDIAKQYSSVLDGRDIGTYVLPSAKYKFFLTATADERAKRRYNELVQKGESGHTLVQIKADIMARDYRDSNRPIAPLKKADDAIEIDSTNMTEEQVIELMLSYIKE